MDNLEILDGLRILAVDDDADTLDLITVIFEEYNVQVTTVTSASEALQGITQLKPNLLISDIAMPDEDGYSLIRKVRSLGEQLNQIPAIALTAHAREEERNLALNAGFSTHVTKPFDPDELIAVVSQLAVIALCDICPSCGTEKLSFVEWESLNKIWFHCCCCKWNKAYELHKAQKAGFVNRYH